MVNNSENPEPSYDVKIRRSLVNVAAMGGAIVLVLLCSGLASLTGFLPKWVSTASCAAMIPTSWVLIGRAAALRKQLLSS